MKKLLGIAFAIWAVFALSTTAFAAVSPNDPIDRPTPTPAPSASPEVSQPPEASRPPETDVILGVGPDGTTVEIEESEPDIEAPTLDILDDLIPLGTLEEQPAPQEPTSPKTGGQITLLYAGAVAVLAGAAALAAYKRKEDE